MLKYQADLKTLLYMTITTSLFVFLWISRSWEYSMVLFAGLYGVHLFMAVSVSVMAHNQMHVPMWKSNILNRITEVWISLFYGFPVFAWIPTHNQNHHRWNNREPDYTKTYKFSEKNATWMALIYPSVSGSAQLVANINWLKDRFRKNKRQFAFCMFQLVALVSWYVSFFAMDWFWAIFLVVIPHQVSLYVVMYFNYIQHVHADEESEYNHSRNIVGNHIGSLNFFLFNNGLHTVHHINARLHWSELPAEHARVQHRIDDRLKEKSFWWYTIRQYILGPIIPSLRTKSMRLERKATEKPEPQLV
ncbi:MAG: fatty acid desaturase [Saprospiraceae bacterium]|nr:fatty acid desaturase [Saprospiraceae bacterium]